MTVSCHFSGNELSLCTELKKDYVRRVCTIIRRATTKSEMVQCSGTKMLIEKIRCRFRLNVGRYILNDPSSVSTCNLEKATMWHGTLLSITCNLCSRFDAGWKWPTVLTGDEFHAGYWTRLFVLSDIHRWYISHTFPWWKQQFERSWYFIKIKKTRYRLALNVDASGEHHSSLKSFRFESRVRVCRVDEH